MTLAKPKQEKINVRPATKAKFDRVGKSTRRKLVDVAELAIDALIEKTKTESGQAIR